MCGVGGGKSAPARCPRDPKTVADKVVASRGFGFSDVGLEGVCVFYVVSAKF